MTSRLRPYATGEVAVLDGAGAASRDASAIAAGVPSRALMQRAGAAAAAEIARRFGDRLEGGVVVATGPGNNGGDGWVVAHALHAVGIPVRVAECVAARTPDARAERELAVGAGVPVLEGAAALDRAPAAVAVDALLGTGLARDAAPLRGAVADAVSRLAALRRGGVALVALDLPSGIDAGTGGDAGAPACDATITFGSVKRGHLVARGACGAIVVVDIGLGAHADVASATPLASAGWFAQSLPRIGADAHKGTRKKVVIVGGAPGMAGAAMLAARGALRSGAGMVRCLVAPESLPAIQEGEPAALAAPWPQEEGELERLVTGWADVVLLGPGLGAGARELTTLLLSAWRGPVVLDADALTAFQGETVALARLVGVREALLTPHPAEFGRLLGCSVEAVLADRFALPGQLAAATGAAVLLKGVPTIVASPSGRGRIVAEGTPLLGTGGSGDILGGMAATLLAQTGDAALAGALAAFAHGRAAQAVSARQVRGYTLDDLLTALPAVWAIGPPPPRPPVLAELPAVGEESW